MLCLWEKQGDTTGEKETWEDAAENVPDNEREAEQEKRREYVVIRIKDNGLGMTEDQCSRLFQQYERVERDAIKNIPGTGLGLYLVKSLVELHGGDIRGDSVQGQGSTFVVRLPITTQTM